MRGAAHRLIRSAGTTRPGKPKTGREAYRLLRIGSVTQCSNITRGVWAGLIVMSLASVRAASAGETNTEERLRLLQQQNDALQEQLRQQREQIDTLNREVAKIRQANDKRDAEVQQLKSDTRDAENAAPHGGFRLGQVELSGEGGLAFFKGQEYGSYPNGEFRVNEARLFVDAPIIDDVYAFTELDLVTPEASDLNVRVGELYLDFANVSHYLWDRDRQLAIRFGQMDVPFGEEYQTRDAIDNPLVSNSLSDLWGIDQGIEFYGSLGRVNYVVAVQNGGVPVTRDFTGDKSVAGRLSYDPNSWLHLSLSGMRTGDVDRARDVLSEIWFGNGWFRALGAPATTTKFYANLVEGDVIIHLPRGHLSGFGGYVYYNDNDTAANNQRNVFYYCLEGEYDVTRKFYGVARFSQILADNGFPVVGYGSRGTYLFGPLTENLWRLSLGLGYRWNRHLVLKTEYSFEQGKLANGAGRHQENLFAVEAAFAF